MRINVDFIIRRIRRIDPNLKNRDFKFKFYKILSTSTHVNLKSQIGAPFIMFSPP